MKTAVLVSGLLAVLTTGAARADDGLHTVRQSYALPDEDFLSLHIDAYGANVVVRNGPTGMVEATFRVPDTLHPPVFRRWTWADSGDPSSFEFARHEQGPAAAMGELWEISIPRELDYISTLHAGFTDFALREADEMLALVGSDSTDLVLDLSGLASGELNIVADALHGDIRLYVPKTAEVFVVAECTLGVLTAPGFSEMNLDQLAEPENDFSYGEHQQGREWRPAEPGGAKVSLLATAARGDVTVSLTE
jgi:hypothetical protein